MTDLLDLLEDWTAATEWSPIYKVYGDLASMIQDDLCRDCGAKSGYNQGGAGAPRGTSYMVCDECAKIDGCYVREHEPVIERHGDQAARCSCGWWISATYWHDDGKNVEYSTDELRDILADHIRPRHSSHWGCYPHEVEECARLFQERERRRARYRAKHPDHAIGS